MSRIPIQVAGDEVHAHAHHTGHRFLDLMLALTAVFISAVSLYVAVEHGRIERDLVEANSWPFMQIDATFSYHGPSTIRLVNAGIGPAKLESFQVLYRGRPVPDLYRLLELCCNLSTDRAKRALQLPDGIDISDNSDQVIRPGESRLVMSIPARPDAKGVGMAFVQASADLQYSACYCSVFDQCWLSRLEGLRPKQVKSCPMGIRSFNRDAY